MGFAWNKHEVSFLVEIRHLCDFTKTPSWWHCAVSFVVSCDWFNLASRACNCICSSILSNSLLCVSRSCSASNLARSCSASTLIYCVSLFLSATACSLSLSICFLSSFFSCLFSSFSAATCCLSFSCLSWSASSRAFSATSLAFSRSSSCNLSFPFSWRSFSFACLLSLYRSLLLAKMPSASLLPLFPSPSLAFLSLSLISASLVLHVLQSAGP